MSRLSNPVALLEAQDLSVNRSVGKLELNLTVAPGEMHLILSPVREDTTNIVDELLGLSGAGSVRFQGTPWREMPADDANRMRSLVGRVQVTGNWIEQLSVLDNLLLPLRHHTVVPDPVLVRRASSLARAFGLPGIPLLPPDRCLDTDLERAACVRAFLGRPRLVMLEHPMDERDHGLLIPLMAMVQRVRRRGGAVVWFTRRRKLFAGIADARSHRIAGRRLVESEGAA